MNFCREETIKAIPKLIKKLLEGVVLDQERIENLTSVFPLRYLSMFEQFSKYKKGNFYYGLLYSKVLKKSAFFLGLNQSTCPVYDAEEIKKQEQQEAIKKLYPKKKGFSLAPVKKLDNPHHPTFIKL